jgi:hypothetical protein
LLNEQSQADPKFQANLLYTRVMGTIMRDPFGESHRRAIRRRLVAPDDAAGDDGGAGDSAGEPGNGPS